MAEEVENPFKRIKIPLIRRIYPQLITPSTQPPVAAGSEPSEVTPKNRKRVWRSIDEPWEPTADETTI